MKILQEWDDIDSNRPNIYRKTPPSSATENWHKELVKMRLERDEVNLHKLNMYGLTSLSHAASNMDERVVMVLLD